MARSPALLSVDRNLQTPSTVLSLSSLADDSEEPKPDETSASAEAQTVFKNKCMSKLEAKDKFNKPGQSRFRGSRAFDVNPLEPDSSGARAGQAFLKLSRSCAYPVSKFGSDQSTIDLVESKVITVAGAAG
ncbi:hypothetical protein BGZ98_007417 [Dissophora globulifera]|nr:hypothetical protein BGZ98_007417 [Dissophora globulifera]